MARKFPDFLTAYAEYANDKFVPETFNEWSGLSVIAGALERKVWLPWNDTYSYYPNIYVMLVARPGVGKSVALNKAVDLLQEVNRKTQSLNILPSQVTEAKFIELMGHGKTYVDRSTGRELMLFQNAGYYFASEASNSLRDIFGSFIACLTDFYDCPATWERATKKDGKKISLKNVCMNVLAGTTFDYLGKLVSDENIQGGFASRILYVVHREKLVRTQAFQMGLSPEDLAMRKSYRDALVHDLTEISKLCGAMKATPEFAAAWEAWNPKFENIRQDMQSEKLQSLLARTNTNAIKLSMIISASESDDCVLRIQHWEKALRMLTAVNEQIPSIFRESKAAQGPRAGGDAATNAILKMVETGRATEGAIIAKMTMNGFNEANTKSILNHLVTLKAIARTEQGLQILGDSNNHL